MSISIRQPTNPQDYQNYSTQRLRQEYLLDQLMVPGESHFVYSHHDRMIAGGIVPKSPGITLPSFEELRSDYFLERREMGIINIGGKGSVIADGQTFALEHGECVYLGRGTKEVQFQSDTGNKSAHYYIISTPAHTTHPNTKQTKADATVEHLGDPEACNERSIYKFIHPDGIKSCQLVMGYTELKSGSVWNTMPAHRHDRRSEIYFYFKLPEEARLFHFMGDPDHTRHLVLSNEQGVISPSWSIHAGAGTAAYSFIWAMGGENQSFADMDFVQMEALY